MVKLGQTGTECKRMGVFVKSVYWKTNVTGTVSFSAVKEWEHA